MSRLRVVVLNAGALLGVLCVLVAAALWVTGSRPLVVQSDSMAPEIHAGDLLLARSIPAADLEVGDVVSVVDGSGVRVTHRIIEVSESGAERIVRLRGDANAVADPDAYTLSRAERVTWVLPGVGSAAAFVDSTPGRVTAIGIVAGCWLAVVLPRRRAPLHARPRRRRGIAPVLVGAALLLPAVLPGARAWAIFDDTATVATAPLAAHRVVAQGQPQCRNEGGLFGVGEYVRLTWPHVDVRYEYRWEARHTATGEVVRSGVVQPAGGRPGELELRSSVLDLGLGATTYDVVVHARLRAAPSWEAAGTTTQVRTSAVLLGLGVRCA
ncbi:signal peptidase I [Aeromicrobium phragmitis]|uniref:Signal peptidase I n=1 Tax=Aeromicrobium phragmitis TaxID=2478914 RepID=A0A3L8PJL4_9ACTN|nr:signal peptidase I [Aeromicrobium phragmitis]RLV55586.1 signal peptidase I [Aeromicrobium phragmitis]